MKITVSGNTITATESETGTYTLYQNREEIQSNETGVFSGLKDGVYFVDTEPAIVLAQLESERGELWESFLDSAYREDIKPYKTIRRFLNQARILFAKNDFFGANKHIVSWR